MFYYNFTCTFDFCKSSSWIEIIICHSNWMEKGAFWIKWKKTEMCNNFWSIFLSFEWSHSLSKTYELRVTQMFGGWTKQKMGIWMTNFRMIVTQQECEIKITSVKEFIESLLAMTQMSQQFSRRKRSTSWSSSKTPSLPPKKCRTKCRVRICWNFRNWTRLWLDSLTLGNTMSHFQSPIAMYRDLEYF